MPLHTLLTLTLFCCVNTNLPTLFARRTVDALDATVGAVDGSAHPARPPKALSTCPATPLSDFHRSSDGLPRSHRLPTSAGESVVYDDRGGHARALTR